MTTTRFVPSGAMCNHGGGLIATCKRCVGTLIALAQDDRLHVERADCPRDAVALTPSPGVLRGERHG